MSAEVTIGPLRAFEPLGILEGDLLERFQNNAYRDEDGRILLSAMYPVPELGEDGIYRLHGLANRGSWMDLSPVALNRETPECHAATLPILMPYGSNNGREVFMSRVATVWCLGVLEVPDTLPECDPMFWWILRVKWM